MSIRVEHLSKQYDKNLAVDNISFSIAEGEIVGFLGTNGAGKSTVMKILTNYIKDFEGEAFINDKSIREYSQETQKLIGYLPEHNPLYPDLFVREFLQFVADIYKADYSIINKVIERLGLKDQAHKKIKALSKGYKQRVGLAAALLHNPEVLILDEPTTGLDPNQLIDIRNLIKEEGRNKTVLFSTHILQEVEMVCDRVIILNKGRIVADKTLKELKSDHKQVVEVAFDTRIEQEFLKRLPQVSTIENVYDNTWLLTFDSAEDCRSKVFDFASDQGIKILNLSQKNQGLESLFKSLTT